MSERPRNAIGTELASDGRPVFNTVTGESRQQYLARLRAEVETAQRARFAKAHAEFHAGEAVKSGADETVAVKSAAKNRRSTSTSTKEE